MRDSEVSSTRTPSASASAVLDGLQRHLMNDELLEVFCDEYTRHLNQLRMEASDSRTRDEARLAKITREMDRLVEAIMDGVPAERIKDRMTALDVERLEIEARLAAQTQDVPPLLHPKMGEVYRKAVAGLRATLTSGPNRAEAIDHIRALIERIVLHPASEEPTGFVMDIEGDLAGILGLSQGHKSKRPPGFRRTTLCK